MEQLFIDGYTIRDHRIYSLPVKVELVFFINPFIIPLFLHYQCIEYVGILDDFESHKFEPIILN